MKFNKIIIFLIIVYATIGFAKPRVTINNNPFHFPTYSPNYVTKYVYLDANNIKSFFYNTGMFNQDTRSGNTAGFEWPKNLGKYACFTSGLCIACYINDSLAQCMASYKGEYVNGAIKYVGGVPTLDNDPKFKIYVVRSSDNAASSPDYANWGLMVPYGAPFDD